MSPGIFIRPLFIQAYLILLCTSLCCGSQILCLLQIESESVHQQRDYDLLKLRWLAFLEIKYFLFKVCTLFKKKKQCYCILNRLHYNVNLTSLCTGKPKKFMSLNLLPFTLLQCFGTEPTISLKYSVLRIYFSQQLLIVKYYHYYNFTNEKNEAQWGEVKSHRAMIT